MKIKNPYIKSVEIKVTSVKFKKENIKQIVKNVGFFNVKITGIMKSPAIHEILRIIYSSPKNKPEMTISKEAINQMTNGKFKKNL